GKAARRRYRLQPAPAPLAWASAANTDFAQSLPRVQRLGLYERSQRLAVSDAAPPVSTACLAEPSPAEELGENGAAIGPEHQHHPHQRASGHHTRRHRQRELCGELWFSSLEQERNERAEEEQKRIVPGEHPGETER